MTTREWRDKRLHRRCVFCTHYRPDNPLGPPIWDPSRKNNMGRCRAKGKRVNDDIPKWFCALYKQMEARHAESDH